MYIKNTGIYVISEILNWEYANGHKPDMRENIFLNFISGC